MSLIRDTLIQIRTELGFESAKAFYRFLSERKSLDFNYAHYMKIEGGKALPSPGMVTSIGTALSQEHSERLTLAYCVTIFPNKRHLFKRPGAPAAAHAPKRSQAEEAAAPTLIKQQSLTEAQVAKICQSSLHYSLFLVLTLARTPVTEEQLSTLLKGGTSEVSRAIRDLESARLIRAESGRISSIANEMRFPKADSDSLRKLYEKIDSWNFDVDRRLGFDNLLQKMMIRRVSTRYLGVILSHSNVLMDLIRAAEEINTDFNDDVLLLNFTLSRGRLPG